MADRGSEGETSAELPDCGGEDSPADSIAPPVSITSRSSMKIMPAIFCGLVKSKVHPLVYLPSQCEPEGSLQRAIIPVQCYCCGG